MKMRTMIKPASIVFLSTGALVLTIIFIELALSFFGYQKRELPWRWSNGAVSDNTGPPYQIYSIHPTRIYALRERAVIGDDVISDEFGFRSNPDHGTEIQAEYRIISLGDSITYGHGVDSVDAYPAQLERMLRQQGIQAIVHNAGVPGYGFDQEYIYARELIERFRPNFLIWNMSPNDIGDSIDACLFTRWGWQYVQFPGWLNSLYLQGYMMQVLPLPFRDLNTTNLLLTFINGIYKNERVTPGCTPLFHTAEEQTLEKALFFVRELKTLAARNNVTMLVVLAPFQNYFFKELANQEERSIAQFLKLRSYLEQNSIQFLDVNREIARELDLQLYVLREHNGAGIEQNAAVSSHEIVKDLSKELFLEFDDKFPFGSRHLNKFGNNAYARAIYNRILKLIQQDVLKK